MDTLHEMLVEDEIFLCGIVLLCGFVAGIAARFIFVGRQRRTA